MKKVMVFFSFLLVLNCLYAQDSLKINSKRIFIKTDLLGLGSLFVNTPYLKLPLLLDHFVYLGHFPSLSVEIARDYQSIQLTSLYEWYAEDYIKWKKFQEKIDYKYYFRKNASTGFFIGAFVKYSFRQNRRYFQYSQGVLISPQSQVQDGFTIHDIAEGGLIGYQWHFAGKFYLEMLSHFGIKQYLSVKALTTSDPNYTPTKHYVDGDLELNIGYLF